MLKTIAWISLGAAVCWVPLSAHAQMGYGVKPGAPSTATFDRSWDRANGMFVLGKGFPPRGVRRIIGANGGA